MSTDDELDNELRHLAHDHLRDVLAGVDHADAWSRLQAEVSDRPTVVNLASRRRDHRRSSRVLLAVAAVAAVVVVGLVGLTLLFVGNDETSEIVDGGGLADASPTSTLDGGVPTSAPESATAVAATPDVAEPSGLPMGYFGRRSGEAIDVVSFDRGGVITGQIDMQPDLVTIDGAVVGLSGPRPDGRCGGRSVELFERGAATSTWQGPEQVRSLAAGTGSTVVATRDVCPGGARWGDEGTGWELFTYDTSRPLDRPVTVLSGPADPAAIQYDDGSFVIAVDERSVSSVNPTGGYVALAVQFSTEEVRWELVELASPGRVIDVPSGCVQAGDIVAPPRFVADEMVVVARVCRGDADVVVELVDVAAETVLWRAGVPGLEPDSYASTAELSAAMVADGSVWVILTAGGGVEEDPTSFVLHEDDRFEITRPGFRSFAFAVDELWGPFER